MSTNSLIELLEELLQTSSPLFCFFSFFIQTTIYLSVTALLIILFKILFKNKLSAKWHVLIWVILLLRFVVPVLPSSPVSIFNFVKINEQTVQQSSYRIIKDNSNEQTEMSDNSEYSVAKGLQKMLESEYSQETNSNIVGSSVYVLKIEEFVVYIWVGGAVILLGYFIIVFFVYRYKLKSNRKSVDDITSVTLNVCKEQLNIKRDVHVCFSDTKPMLMGLFRPAIYIPEGYSQAELRDTLLHELNHMKNFDILWSTIATLLLCLNWFNPIIWFSFFMFKRDIEVFCDERTLRYSDNKQNYARLLLKTATSRKEKFVLGTTSLESGKADVKRRIRYMAKFKKPAKATVVIAVIMISVISFSCLTNAPKISFTDLESHSDYDRDYISSKQNDNSDLFVNETLGEPDLSDVESISFSSLPDVIYADDNKAIISGDCGIVVYDFKQKAITLRASYQYLRKLGVSLPFGFASVDGKEVYIKDGEENIAVEIVNGVKKENGNFLSLILDIENRTLKENTAVLNTTFGRYSIGDLSPEEKLGYGIDENYVGGAYVKFKNNIVYVQCKPDWSPKNLSLVKYNKATGKTEEFKIFAN